MGGGAVSVIRMSQGDGAAGKVRPSVRTEKTLKMSEGQRVASLQAP